MAPGRSAIPLLLAAWLAAGVATPGTAAQRLAGPDITGSLGGPATRAEAPGDAARLRAVLAAYRRGELGGGDAAAEALRDPAARAAADWVAIRTAPRQVGATRILAFLQRYPAWPAAGALRRRAEEALYLDGTDAATVRRFFAGAAPRTGAGRLALARAMGGSEATALARTAYRDDDLADSVEAELRGRGILTRADHRARAVRLVFAGDYARGLRAAERAGPDVAALVRAQIGAARKAGNAPALLAAVPATLRSDPAALFARVQVLRRAGKAEEAASVLARAPREESALVDPDAWWVERRMVSRALLDAGKARAAYGVAAAQVGGSDTTRLDADFHAGWIALRFLGDAGTAGRHFAALSALAERPISLSRGAYWQGRAAEAAGNKAAATRFYQVAARSGATYYGALARARLGLSDIALRGLPQVSAEARLAFSSGLAVKAIALLYAAGDEDDARALVSAQADAFGDAGRLTLLAQMAAGRGDARAALTVGKSAVQRGFPLEAIAFPTSTIPSFRSVSDVERAVVFGIARQESEFNHAAVSRAGARGLMQMMPATAQSTARAAGLKFDARRLTHDPAYNAQLGSAHLGDLLDRYRGSYILTFAAYNAGPSNVADWLSTYGDPRQHGVDPIDWVERIPFQETRNYVQRVMENVQVYRSRLNARSALLIDRDLRRGEVE